MGFPLPVKSIRSGTFTARIRGLRPLGALAHIVFAMAVSLAKYESTARKLSSAQDRARRSSRKAKENKTLASTKARVAVAQTNRAWAGMVIVGILMTLLGGAVGGQLERIRGGKVSRVVGTGSFALGLLLILLSVGGRRIRPLGLIAGMFLMGIGGTQFTMKAMKEDWVPGSWKWDPTGSQPDQP